MCLSKYLSLCAVLVCFALPAPAQASSIDYNNDCEITEADAHLFLKLFHGEQPGADLAEPIGEFNYFDVSAFLKSYNVGFPDSDLAQCLGNDGEASLEPCNGLENENIYPVSTYSGGLSCPTENARVIFVSALGNDSNDGLSMSSPKLTLAAAKSRLRVGAGDWMVLKRGDIFNDSFGGVDEKDGIDVNNPTVIGAYGDQISVRPVVKVNDGGSGLSIKDVENFTVADIAIKVNVGYGGSSGVSVFANQYNAAGVENVVVENVFIQGFKDNLKVQISGSNNDYSINNVLLKDNIIVDAASKRVPGGHSQGVYVNGPDHVKLINNVIDHNGYVDRDCVTDACDPDSSQGASVFNHNIYWQKKSGPTYAVHNIITRASASGLQARSGGEINENIFSRNPSAFFLGGFPREEYRGAPSFALDNVVLEDAFVNSTSSAKTGVRHKTAYNALFKNNIVANSDPAISDGTTAFQIRCSLSNDYGQEQAEIDFGYEQCAANIVDNIVYNFARGDVSALQITGGIHGLPGVHTVAGNEFFGAASLEASRMITVHQSAPDVYDLMVNGDKFNIIGNVYHGIDVLEYPDLMRFKAQGLDMAFMDWVDFGAETKPSYSTSSDFSDPCRTLGTYYDDMILGNLDNDNCSIMNDDELFDDFMSLLRSSRNRLVRNQDLETVTILNYIREGFDKEPIE